MVIMRKAVTMATTDLHEETPHLPCLVEWRVVGMN
jgi:hypothetical protein